MNPEPRTGKIGRTEKDRLSQMEDNYKTVQTEKHSEILAKKRNPSDEDRSTMKQATVLKDDFNPLTEKAFKTTAEDTKYRTPELSERRARAIAYADSLPEPKKKLIIETLASRTGRKFGDLNEAIQLIDADGATGAKDILLTKDDANTFLKRVVSPSNSVVTESSHSGSKSNVDTETPIEIKGSFNKIYTNKEILGYFGDNSYLFSLNKNCSISYNTDRDEEDNHKVNILYFICAPFSPISDSEQSDNNSSIKGSGALMLVELLKFLVTKGLNGYNYKKDDYVYLDPVHIGDKRYDDRHLEDLYMYYHSLNFEMTGRNTMRATINAIITSERIRGEEGVIKTFQKLTNPPDSTGKGGRRKLTKKKHTRRKSRKTRKTRKSRKSRRRR
jgi:hypothetical protein